MKRNRRPRQDQSGTRTPPPPTPAPAIVVPTISRRRRWAFRCAALLLGPLLFLGVLEGALRLGGYGHPTCFFRPMRIEGEEVLVANDAFGRRFFPPEWARSPTPTVMKATKPPGTFRIFLFGESAALGDPRPAHGMGRYLEVLLRERYPQARFEVVCVAMTAINSHAILPIARECARYQGDLWILYLGHNEVAGPYGANTIFGPQAPHWRWVRLSLALKATWTGQLLEAASHALHGASRRAPDWTGLKLFQEHQLPPGDPRREAVCRNFRRNLEDILRTGLDSGVQIVLCTPASNLKDCAPFASLHRHPLAETELGDWNRLYAQGASLQSEGKVAEALQVYEQAQKLDPEFAELRFRQGQCFLALTNGPEAYQRFRLARDWDALPFRADTPLADILAEAASRLAHPRLHQLNAPDVLGERCAGRIPGQEVFYEHVHLNPTGNYGLARALARQIAGLVPSSVGASASTNWASPELCEQRLGLTDWNRQAVYEELLSRISDAPFTNQLNHPAQVGALVQQLRDVRTRLHPSGEMDARFTYEDALARNPRDFRLHENFAEFLELTGNLDEALTQWQAVRQSLPYYHLPYYQLGRLQARRKNYAEAQLHLRQALRIRPDLAEAHMELGRVLYSERKPEEALRAWERARQLRPADPTTLVYIADALAAQNKRTEAIESLRAAVRLRPTYSEARYLLGVELGMDEKLAEAQAQFEEVIRLRPNHVLAHLNLGVMLVRQRRAAEARREFEEVLRLDPQNQKARQHLQTLESLMRPRGTQ